MKTLFLSTLLFIQPAFAEKIVLEFEDVDVPPWRFHTDKSGLDFILLKLVDEKLPEVEFEYRAVPWKRCLEGIEIGAAQGCLGGSYKKEREVHGAYPTKNGAVDETKRMYSTSYSLYTTKDKKDVFKVQGLHIEGLAVGAAILAPFGYSIVDDLKKAGHNVDSSGKSTETNFRTLAAGKAHAVAGLTNQGQTLMTRSEFKNIIEIKPPLINKAYYLLFSHHFMKQKPGLAEKIWKKIEIVRESKEFKKRSDSFLND